MSTPQQLVAEPEVQPQKSCPNCEELLAGKFCSHCGQQDKHLDPSLHDLVHEATHELLHLDGKILATLKALLFSPGRLTLEHFAGRRARYIGPIRLYLTLSLIFFIIAAHAAKTAPVVRETGGEKQSVSIQSENAPEAASSAEKRLTAALKKSSEDPEMFRHAFLTNVSRVMFLMVPLFALGLRIAYRKRTCRYPGFIYFSLHYHSLVFFALSVSYLAEFTHASTLTTWVDRALVLWCLVYLLMALRKVFGGTWKNTMLRIAALALVYFPCFGIGLAVAAIVSLFVI
jgi:hypothetical protein